MADKFTMPASNAQFYRDGARYICAVCKNKFFTKDEVVKCAESHGEGGESVEYEAPVCESPAPVTKPASTPPINTGAPSITATLLLKQETIDKLNAIAKKHNTEVARLIEKLVEKAFVPAPK